MSDLAPFVAAAIRDQVVSDLYEENQRLSEELDAAMRVTITGSRHSQPVYASADFSRGHSEEGSAFWSLRFPDDETASITHRTTENIEEEAGDSSSSSTSVSSNSLPLSRLVELEIFVGGILLCEMSQDYVEGFSSLDSTTGAVRFLELELRKCWITLEIVQGTISEESLDVLLGASMGRLWRVLSGHVAASNPHARLRVREISLDTKYVPGLVRRVPPVIDPHTEETQRQRAESQALQRAIVTRLRRNNPTIRGSNTLLAQGRTILESVQSRGIRNESDPRLDSAMDTLLILEADRLRGLQTTQLQQQRQGSNPNLFPVAR
jgi:hypothetical protein